VTTAGTLVRGVRALLPRDVLIGTIVEVLDDPSQFSKAARIQPAADLDRLEGVLVITSYDAPTVPDPDATPEPEPEPEPSAAPARTDRPRNNNNNRPERTRAP
jgi:cell shape-determining protein MreC